MGTTYAPKDDDYIHYTPQDALRYLNNAHPLDAAAELILAEYGDDDDNIADPVIRDILAMIDTTSRMIRNEHDAHIHGALKQTYSNGVPTFVTVTSPEINELGQAYIAKAHRAVHPAMTEMKDQ